MSQNVYSQWYDGASDVNIVMAPMSHDGIVTVDGGGSVRLWETALFNLDKSLRKWRALLGDKSDKPLEVIRYQYIYIYYYIDLFTFYLFVFNYVVY